MAINWKNKDKKEKKKFYIDKKWAAAGIGLFIFLAAYVVVLQYAGWYSEVIYVEESFRYWWAGKVRWITIWMLVIASFPWVYGVVYKGIGKEKRFFRTPVEIPVTIFIFMMGYLINYGWGLIAMKDGLVDAIDLLFWTVVFAIVYWCSACFRPVYEMGVAEFLKRQTLTGRILRWLIRKMKEIRQRVKNNIEKMIESWTEFDFQKEKWGIILKIAGANCLILLVFVLLIPYKVFAIFLYSVFLFFFLRHVYRRLGIKYAMLLRGTNEIAEGNLDVKIEEDLWIFNPLKNELEQIQDGFKKAVEKEMQSQHMKTELITNVSHDLKTPLTAIITYVSLLKKEEDEDKRKEYIHVLERKSLRLKVLIEDLFEISKVSSNNVKLNLADVDLANLMKQVILELEDKIINCGVEFRCSYSKEKVTAVLDGQVTYRIFENLIVNITKYAMPGTRAYIGIEKEKEKVIIRMKNVSAAEINFDPEELTERFVRGDRARNTEGSGLGLAIAKSFTELQGGTFKLETEADLFKVEIGF